MVIVRQKIKEGPQAAGRTLTLFPDDEIHRNYRYSAYIKYGVYTEVEGMLKIESKN